jgi:hypothetical protein
VPRKRRDDHGAMEAALDQQQRAVIEPGGDVQAVVRPPRHQLPRDGQVYGPRIDVRMARSRRVPSARFSTSTFEGRARMIKP